MAIPAKAFAQDWVYFVGNVMILAVAPIAVYLALPFFRRIDATSAYEYLEKRFNRAVRLIGSGSFSLFHVFRMGVVLALAALALASVTPLTPTQCVIVMGVLSIIYCTLGGIEAVIWTDTIQTFVLFGGALLCLFFAISRFRMPGSWAAAVDAGKLHAVNLEFQPGFFHDHGDLGRRAGWSWSKHRQLHGRSSRRAALHDNAATTQQAARSIWFNGLMAVPAAVLFFGMGTAFWMFYRSHPGQARSDDRRTIESCHFSSAMNCPLDSPGWWSPEFLRQRNRPFRPA